MVLISLVRMRLLGCLAVLLVLVLCSRLCDGSQKKGLGVAWWAYVCGDMDLLGRLAWWYDWQQETKHYITWYNCQEMWSHRWNYVPMVNKVSNESFHLENHTNSGFVLGYNEPNHVGKTGCTGRQGGEYWAQVEQAAVGQKLVSPAATPCGGNCYGGPFDWFDEFFQHCNGCIHRMDYIATHMYNCNATKIMDYLHTLYTRYHKKIWLTEFGCPNNFNTDDQLAFLKEIMPQLEAAHYVYRYAWFVHRERKGDGFITPAISLFQNQTVALTPLGEYYVNFGTSHVVVG